MSKMRAKLQVGFVQEHFYGQFIVGEKYYVDFTKAEQ